MRFGRLDRRIRIDQPSGTQDVLGQPAPGTWTEVATVWAQRMDRLRMDRRGQERFAAERDIAVRSARYRIRWRSGINETMTVLDEGTRYHIRGISDDRRRGWMELVCEAFDPEESGS